MQFPTIGQYAATLANPFGLFRTLGEPVAELDAYGAVRFVAGNTAEGLFVVEKTSAYGYIPKDGSVAVGMIYDDAVSFTDGTGRVALRGRTYLIDPEGNLVDEITEAQKEPAPTFI